MLAVHWRSSSRGMMEMPRPASTMAMLDWSSMTWQRRSVLRPYFLRNWRISASVASHCTTKFWPSIRAGVITPFGGSGQSAGVMQSSGSLNSSVRVNSSRQVEERNARSIWPVRSHSLTSS